MDKALTCQELSRLEVLGPSSSQPMGRSLNQAEAEHLISLLTPTNAAKLRLEFSRRDGSDCEDWRYYGIRRIDGTTPDDERINRVYTCSFCYWCNFNFGPDPSYDVAQKLLMVLRALRADCSAIPEPTPVPISPVTIWRVPGRYSQ